jgi:hypothetical protein
MTNWISAKTERAQEVIKSLIEAGFNRQEIIKIFADCSYVMAPEGHGVDVIGSIYDKESGVLPAVGTRVIILAYPEHNMTIVTGNVRVANQGEDHFIIELDDGSDYKMVIGSHPGWITIKE